MPKGAPCIDCGATVLYDKSHSLCKACHIKRSNTYHMQNYRFRKVGVTREWYEEEAKKGCAICKTPLDPYSKVKRLRGHLDHCHTTGVARGVLCDLCNKGLGQFRDNIDYLTAAIDYLKNRR